MPRFVERLNPLDDGRRRGGDMADEILDRQRVRHVASRCAEVSRQVSNLARREPLGAFRERARQAELRRDAFAHRAEIESIDEHRRPVKVLAHGFFVKPVVVSRANERVQPRDGFRRIDTATVGDLGAGLEIHIWQRSQ